MKRLWDVIDGAAQVVITVLAGICAVVATITGRDAKTDTRRCIEKDYEQTMKKFRLQNIRR